VKGGIEMRLPKSLQDEFVKLVDKLGISSHYNTGSRRICPKHAASDADWDVACLVDELPQIGEAYCGAEHPYFESIKVKCDEGILNIIATDDRVFYELFKAATNVAEWLNLTERSDRVKLFQVVLYGKHVSPPEGVKSVVREKATS